MLKAALLGLVCVMFAGCGGAPDEASKAVQPSADTEFQALVNDIHSESGIVALGVAIVTADTLDIAVAGERVSGSGDLVQPDDLWHLGSDTKAMTALLYADLVWTGSAAWGETLPELFPDIAAEMDPAWSEVTIEHLFSHRAGVGNVDGAWLMKSRVSDLSLPEQRLATSRDVLTGPPATPIGDYAYSNLGYIIAAAAMEQRTGRAWEELMQLGLVGAALGEDGWGFGPPQGDQPQGHVLSGASRIAVGQAWQTADNPRALGPAGTVHASLETWAQFVRVFFDDNGVITDELRTKLTTPPFGGDYALGWGVGEDEAGRRILQHAGSNTMWFAQAIVWPDQNVAVLVVANEGTPMAQMATSLAAERVSDFAFGISDY